ncbi:MAG: alkaline phosphatase family protein [Myxococcota bacterium]
MARLLLVFAVALSMGCFSCSPKAPDSEPTIAKPAPSEPIPRGKAEVAPKLVVLVVMDQLASWVLDMYLPILPDESFLRRVSEEGTFLQAALPYASTQTAPGHASLTTGVPPSMHGIVANAIYDPKHGPRKTVDDKTHTTLGNPARFVSPIMLKTPTVADGLLQKTDGRARVVGISIKARAAVLPVGKKPTAAIYYDSTAKGMTTSTYYQPNLRLPDWLRDFVTANPVEPLLQAWEPERPSWLEANFGPDPRMGEMFPIFPHDPKDAENPYEAFMSFPESTDYLIAAAYAAVKAEQMGLDDAPDLLVLGVSGTDIVGHIWGPRSWEYADNLVRTDRALGRFAAILESRGPVAFVLTADHGIAAMPESIVDEGGDAGRLKHQAVVAHAERAADQALGPGDWIAAYVPPLVSYTEAGKKQHEALDKALLNEMPKLKGVKGVYDAHDGAALRSSSRDIEKLVGNSLPVDPPGDLYLVTDEHWFDALSELGGTNHGTPWAYDRLVPVILWGAGIEKRSSDRIHSVLQVATSLAALLGVPAPALAPQEPLPGVMQLPD